MLKKGGGLLIFDANYANMKNLDATLNDEDKKEEPYGHQGMTYALEAEYAYFTKAMDLGRHQRPEYDIALLEKYGFSNCSADKAIGKKLLKEKRVCSDLMLRFIDQDGEECKTSLKDRTASISLEEYKQIPQKIIVASGEQKA